MKEVSIPLMLDLADQRWAVRNCTRCGGSGEFVTVNSPATAGRGGVHCYQCGHAYHTPRKWNISSLDEKLSWLKEPEAPAEQLEAIKRLRETRILKEDDANALMDKISGAGT